MQMQAEVPLPVRETANCREGTLAPSTLDKVKYIHHVYSSPLLVIENMAMKPWEHWKNQSLKNTMGPVHTCSTKCLYHPR